MNIIRLSKIIGHLYKLKYFNNSPGILRYRNCDYST